MHLKNRLPLLTTTLFILTAPAEVEAACNTSRPAEGQTVICDNTTPNPDLSPVISDDGISNVSVILNADSSLINSSGVAISLGDGSTIENAGIISGTTAGLILRDGSSIIRNSGTISASSGPAVQFAGSGNNQLFNSGTLSGAGGSALTFGAGADSFVMLNGQINGAISLGDGNDRAEIRGGIITGAIAQGTGVDDFIMSGGTLNALQQGDGRDTFTMTGGTIIGAFEDGDVASMSGGQIGRVDMKLDNNIFDMSGGQIVGNLVAGFSNDTILISGNSTIGGNISVSGGRDSVTVTGGDIAGEIRMSNGNDLFHWEGGTIRGAVLMGDDDDIIEFRNLAAAPASSSPVIDGGNGDDTLTMNNSQYVHRAANILQGIEHVFLTQQSVLTLQNQPLALGDAQNDAAGTGYSIDGTSTLVVENNNAVMFNSHLSGTGNLATRTSGNAFDFTANNADDNFAGTLALGNSRFDLSGLNTRALNAATLNAGSGSVTTVGAGEQRIGGLQFNGGVVDFGALAPGDRAAGHTIQTGKTLDLQGTGTVKIAVNDLINDLPTVDDRVPLLSQDDGNSLIKLAGSDGTVTGTGGGLSLVDDNGTTITDSITKSVLQGGKRVAGATWDWRLSSGTAQDGLYIAYALQKLTLEGEGNSALVLNSQGQTGNAADLSARITGSGDLAIDGVGGTVSLSNQGNDYSGITQVRRGRLLMRNNNVLGNTSLLEQAAATVFDMNGFTQTTGSINTARGALTALSGGNLTIASGGTIRGNLSGDGLLNLTSGTLDIFGANRFLTATTRLYRNAILNLDNTSGAGSGEIDNAGLLKLNAASGTLVNSLSNNGQVSLADSQVILSGDNRNFSGTFSIDNTSSLTVSRPDQLGSAAVADSGALIVNTDSNWILTNSVTGSGELIKYGSGVIELVPQSAAYTGQTTIFGGGVEFGSRNAPMTVSSGQINIENGYLAGNGTLGGSVTNKGVLNVGSGNQPALAAPIPIARTLNTARIQAVAFDQLTIAGNLLNGGLVQIGQTSAAAPGNRLTVNGNYQGDGGRILFNTALGDDNSATDRMLVSGNTSGRSLVKVNNLGGSGAVTRDGIELIAVNGASDGDFIQDGRIVAGAYDYRLSRGAGVNQKNWYLTNNAGVPPGAVAVGSPVPEGQNAGSDDLLLRPEAGSYISNLVAANTLFSLRLHDRLGETQFVDDRMQDNDPSSLWLRQVGSHSSWHADSGELKTTENQYVVMLGADMASWSNEKAGRGQLGVMAGYGNNQSKTRSSLTGFRSSGKTDGYSAGLYGTWYASQVEKTGLYVDGWAQYSWFNNSVQGEGLTEERYHSDGITASLESGYTLALGEFNGSKGTLNRIYLQPQAQVTWMNVRADRHIEQGGTRVDGHGDGNLQSRLGARLFLNSHHAMDNGKAREFEPFIEANWIHNSRVWGIDMNGVRIDQAGATDIGEIKTGVEGKLNQSVTLWGSVGQQIGDNSFANTTVLFGLKYRW